MSAGIFIIRNNRRKIKFFYDYNVIEVCRHEFENVVPLCDQKMIFLVTVSSRLVAANWGKTRPQSQIIAVASTELQNIKYTITMETWLKWLKLYREKMETSWHDKSFLFYLQSTFYNSVDILVVLVMLTVIEFDF